MSLIKWIRRQKIRKFPGVFSIPRKAHWVGRELAKIRQGRFFPRKGDIFTDAYKVYVVVDQDLMTGLVEVRYVGLVEEMKERIRDIIYDSI